ncbi:MAG: TolC family protein [Nannocystaceae bacterium]|nr:TolC family protein [Nannocystaceae bacterium]
MARTLTLVLLGLSAGCFHAAPYTSTTSHGKWRSMRGSTTSRSDGAPTPSAGATLDAEQAIALALQNNPDVAALVAASDVAEAEVGAAKQLDNPQLRLTGFNLDDAIGGKAQMNVGLRVPIPRPGAIKAQSAGARQLAASADASAQEAERLLRARVYKLYARLAMLSWDLEETSRAAQLRADRREQIAARAALSAATDLDVAVADVLHAEAKSAQALVRDQLETVQQELQRIVGTDVPVQFAVDREQLAVVDRELDRDALVERAMAQRPMLRAAHANVEAARAEVFVARSMTYPWFDWAQVQYAAARDSKPTAFGFGLAIQLPIFSWNRGEIRASRALVRQRELEQQAELSRVAGEVDAAVAAVERTGRRVTELEHELLPQVEAAVKQAEAAQASGALDPVLASDIDTRAVEARRIHLAALLAHREAVIELEAVVGERLGQPSASERGR